jgi:hypothetical protein
VNLPTKRSMTVAALITIAMLLPLGTLASEPAADDADYCHKMAAECQKNCTTNEDPQKQSDCQAECSRRFDTCKNK